MNTESENRNFQIPLRKESAPNSIQNAENTQIPIKTKTPIISFTGKKKRLRFSLRKIIMPLLALLLAFCLLLAYLDKKLSPQMPSIAENGARAHLYKIVNEAVEDLSDDGLLSYDSIVKTRRDEMGQVIYLEVNTALLNKAKAVLIRRIDQKLEEDKKIKISVPIGAITQSNLLSGKGFDVSVRVHPIGMTEGEIYTVLEDCGINQTRHLIQIRIRAEMMILFSGQSKNLQMEITLPLGERVLMGDVPEIYLDNIGGN